MSQCTAKSKRSKERCRKWAIKGKLTCHMHGGQSTGPKTDEGKERFSKTVQKHGKYTKKALAQHREVMELIRKSKNLLESLCG